MICLFYLEPRISYHHWTVLASAQDFPSKPITFIVPFTAGSATNQLGRTIGQGVTEQTGQSIIVENRPGASGMIGTSMAACAAPDGYTVLIDTNTSHAANQHLYKKLAYDPFKDFIPIPLLGQGGQIMVVNPSSSAKTVKEFLALARKEPGRMSFASGSASRRIAGELFQQIAGVEMLHVPYKSNPLAVTDLLDGQTDMIITDAATGLPQTQSGKLWELGVTSLNCSALLPYVRPIAEAGLPGYEMGYWFAAYVPAGTPDTVVTRLNVLLTKPMSSAAARQFYESTGTEAVPSTSVALAQFQQAESEK